MAKRIVLGITMILLVAIGWLGIATISDKNNEYMKYLLDANELCEKGYYADAIELFEKAAADKPKNADPRRSIAICYFNLNDSTNFTSCAENYLIEFGPDSSIYAALVYYYFSRSDYENAFGYLREGLIHFPDDEELVGVNKELRGSYTEDYTNYDYISEFKDGCAIARLEDRERLIRHSGSTIGNNSYDRIYDFYINKKGEIILSVDMDGQALYVDQYDRLRISPEENYSYLGGFDSGYALVETENGWSYIDSDFNKIDEDYEAATAFSSGFAMVKMNGKWAIINAQLHKVTSFIYDEVDYDEFMRAFVNGVCSVKNGKGEYALIDFNGNEVASECELDTTDCELVGFKSDNGLWGIMDINGEVYIEPKFELVSDITSDGYARVKLDGVYKEIQLNCYKTEESLF